MNIAYLIISIINLIAFIAFLSWGIYQIRTGKMVARYAKSPIDEPREVGVIFLLISALALWITILTAAMFFFPDPTALFYLSGMLFELLGSTILGSIAIALICIGTIGIKNHRIFGLKNLPKVKKLTQKYYLLTDISLIATTALVALAFIFGSSLSMPVIIIFAILAALGIITTVAPLILISRTNKK